MSLLGRLADLNPRPCSPKPDALSTEVSRPADRNSFKITGMLVQGYGIELGSIRKSVFIPKQKMNIGKS